MRSALSLEATRLQYVSALGLWIGIKRVDVDGGITLCILQGLRTDQHTLIATFSSAERSERSHT